MLDLAYLQAPPTQTARLKSQYRDFIVREHLGYEMSGDGEFVAVKIRKTDCNTLFVGEKLAQFCGISAKNMGYAGLKDRKAVTEQWFCLQMPGQPTPDFSSFQLDGVEILQVTRHNRKIRVGSLDGNFFEILLRDIEKNDALIERLEKLAKMGFPNYFTEQRFGHENHNLTQAMRWANDEIKVKDRKKRSFYLSAARSEIFNQIVSERLKMGLAQQVVPNDILQLNGTHSWFVADLTQNINELQHRLEQGDLQITAPLIGDKNQNGCEIENQIVQQNEKLIRLMQSEKVKAARRPLLIQAKELIWTFTAEGLKLNFYLPAGSYATALIREIAKIDEE